MIALGNLWKKSTLSFLSLATTYILKEALAIPMEIIANPLLVNLFKGDYRLTAKSPAIDNGYDDGHYSFDLDGNPIVSKRDIGAYEFQLK